MKAIFASDRMRADASSTVPSKTTGRPSSLRTHQAVSETQIFSRVLWRIHLRNEIRHPALGPHFVQEFVAALRIDIPLARDVVHGDEHLGLVVIAVELDQSGIRPQLAPVEVER